MYALFIDISLWEWLLFGLLFAAFVYQVTYYAVNLRGGRAERQRGGAAPFQPPVTVVVCARNEEQNLERYLHRLLTQDYPVYEVIVVNDGSMDRTSEVLAIYQKQDYKLRTTFVPAEARVASTKKLGITLAAKAAQHDYLLLTDADCCPESNQWITEMVQPFANSKVDIVLGYGAYFEQDTALNRWIQYDTQFNALHYLGAARRGKPYMGVGRNMAYRKEFFFRMGGFTDLLSTRAGDDDLFVNKNATKSNTQIVRSAASVTWSEPKTTWKSWIEQKRRHLSVAPHYSQHSKWQLLWEPLTRGLCYALLVVLLVWGTPLVRLAALALMLIRGGWELIAFNLAIREWRHPLWGVELMVFEVLMPLVQVYLMITRKQYKGDKW